MRICSFLPSATEILYALGLGEAVVGVSYECDTPGGNGGPEVVVHSRLRKGLSSGEIDRQVKDFLARGESLYRVDMDALARLQPDLIVTQDLCHVCAASPDDLPAALAALARPPQVVTLAPRTLAEVWNDIRKVGEATGRAAAAERLVEELQQRVAAVEKAVADAPARPRVLCLEWLDPPFVGGHWVPEMVERAGGQDVLGRAGEPSFSLDWEKVLASQPEVVIVLPCGYGLAGAVDEFKSARLPADWKELPAVRAGRVYAVDASRYFSRPGPQLATGVELLGTLLHPDRISASVPDEALTRLR